LCGIAGRPCVRGLVLFTGKSQGLKDKFGLTNIGEYGKEFMEKLNKPN